MTETIGKILPLENGDRLTRVEVQSVLQMGLATSEHQTFIKRSRG